MYTFCEDTCGIRLFSSCHTQTCTSQSMACSDRLCRGSKRRLKTFGSMLGRRTCSRRSTPTAATLPKRACISTLGSTSMQNHLIFRSRFGASPISRTTLRTCPTQSSSRCGASKRSTSHRIFRLPRRKLRVKPMALSRTQKRHLRPLRLTPALLKVATAAASLRSRLARVRSLEAPQQFRRRPIQALCRAARRAARCEYAVSRHPLQRQQSRKPQPKLV
mmetsp:Transcript_4940/g.13289  ORF Transcript_4940/g.13289 Transcript_4940/m.13289 type:complete len:219 (+) Transcript_4940:697-1353(+)